MKFSFRQILASASGAVLAAVIASLFGVKGTIVGVAIGSAAATFGTTFVAQSIERGHDAMKQVVVRVPDGSTLLRRLGGTKSVGETDTFSGRGDRGVRAALHQCQPVRCDSGHGSIAGDRSGRPTDHRNSSRHRAGYGRNAWWCHVGRCRSGHGADVGTIGSSTLKLRRPARHAASAKGGHPLADHRGHGGDRVRSGPRVRHGDRTDRRSPPDRPVGRAYRFQRTERGAVRQSVAAQGHDDDDQFHLDHVDHLDVDHHDDGAGWDDHEHDAGRDHDDEWVRRAVRHHDHLDDVDHYDNDDGPGLGINMTTIGTEPTLVTSSDGVRIAVHDLGAPAGAVDAPVILFSHATGFHGLVWQPLAAHLRDQFHCIAIDHRGHGRTEKPPSAPLVWSSMGDDVLAVLDAGLAAPGVAVHAVGHSMGGASLVLAAARRPGAFRSLWLYEPVIVPPGFLPSGSGPNPMAEAAARRRKSFDSYDEAFNNYASKPPLSQLHSDALRAYVEGGFSRETDGSVTLRCAPDSEADVYRGAGNSGAWDVLAELDLPVAIVAGRSEGDGFGPVHFASSVVDALPRGTLIERRHLGHFGPLEDPTSMAADVRNWVEAKNQ